MFKQPIDISNVVKAYIDCNIQQALFGSQQFI